MAKTKKELNSAQQAAKAARAALKVAKETVAKTKNASTEKALEAANAAASVAVKAENRDRFLRVGGSRVARALEAIKNVGALGNARSYEFDTADVSKIESALNNALASAVSSLKTAHAVGAATKKASTFTF